MASQPSRKESLRPPDCNNQSKIRLQGVTSSQEVLLKEAILGAWFNSRSSRNVCILEDWKEWENPVWSLRLWLLTMPWRYIAYLTLDLTVEYVLALEQDSYGFLRGSHSECLFQHNNNMCWWFVSSQWCYILTISYITVVHLYPTTGAKKSTEGQFEELFKQINASRLRL